MTHPNPPTAIGFPHLLHGGDYNPEQWIRTPQVWDEDFRLMKLAGVNTVSLGIFAWAMLEPGEGHFEFGWMNAIFDKAEANGIGVILATPGGARPAWMAFKYPEVLRVDQYRRQQKWGGRHNHCFTSPVYREKCRIINTRLAQRYGERRNLLLWHVNNEYSGECHCDLCQDAFRDWLRGRYDSDLDKLNHAWWSTFWSHTITDWSQIEPPSKIGETQVHGHTLDWKRFCTHQHIDCFKAEREPLQQITPDVPVTTNFMGVFHELDYYKFARELDIVSWDSYPSYHDRPNDWLNAVTVSFLHSQRRAMLDKPFLLMESAPAMQNYKPVCKLKRPGLHVVEGLQAVAHGSDSVLYFQWRKSRGGFEKFHGAVVDHFASEDNRVFQEVADLGRALAKLDDVVGAHQRIDVALIYDYENRWAIDDAAGPRNVGKNYLETCVEHFRPFWSNGVAVDVIGEDHPFEHYKLLIAPMLYLLRPGVAERIDRFVERGGTFVTTYFSGMVNESDLAFLDGFPGPLRKLLGIRAEETDTPYDEESVAIVPAKGSGAGGKGAGLSGKYQARQWCDLIHAEGAKILATYGGEFYKGRPALTVNAFGQGRAYYIASRNDARFHADFYGRLIDELDLKRALGAALPDGVTAVERASYVFVLGFNRVDVTIDLGRSSFRDVLSGKRLSKKLRLPRYNAMVLERTAKTQAVPVAGRKPGGRARVREGSATGR
ncbi:MAG TPA: beta-galactosidase [Tepidisphaeraceae bacterium]|nr:beta-galactosidase [Tepidisphaeraceae bacterium]